MASDHDHVHRCELKAWPMLVNLSTIVVTPNAQLRRRLDLRVDAA